MNGPARKLSDRELEAIQDRHRRNWNRMVREDENEYRAALAEAEERRADFQVIEGGDNG